MDDSPSSPEQDPDETYVKTVVGVASETTSSRPSVGSASVSHEQDPHETVTGVGSQIPEATVVSPGSMASSDPTPSTSWALPASRELEPYSSRAGQVDVWGDERGNIAERQEYTVRTDVRQIYANFTVLCENVEPKDVIPDLITCGVLNLDDMDFVANADRDMTRRARFLRLMWLLYQKYKSGQRNVWDKFAGALVSSGADHYAQLINDTDPNTVPYVEDGLYHMIQAGQKDPIYTGNRGFIGRGQPRPALQAPPPEIQITHNKITCSATTNIVSEHTSAYTRLVDQSSEEIHLETDVFVETSSYQTAQALLQQHGLLFIIGPSTCGKTTIGTALLRHHQDLGSDPLVLHRYEEFREHVTSSKKQVVLLDDPFGQDEFLYSEYQKWSHAIKILHKHANAKKIFTVVLIRDSVLSDMGSKTDIRKMLAKSKILNMVEADPFTDTEKTCILNKHKQANNKTVTETVMHDIVSTPVPNQVFLTHAIEFVEGTATQFDTSLYMNQQSDDKKQSEENSLNELLHMLDRCKRITDSLQLNVPTGNEGYLQKPPFHKAAEKGQINAVTFLLDSKIVIDNLDCNQATALHYATSTGIARLLLERGASSDLAQKDGWTPLHIASSKGLSEVVQLLIDFKADVNKPTTNGDYPLHLAATSGDVNTVRVLINSGADINSRDKYKRTPLHLSCFHGYFEIATLLLDKDADLEAEDNTKATPLHTAVYEGHVNVTRLLIDRGANKEHRADYKRSHVLQKYNKLHVNRKTALEMKPGEDDEVCDVPVIGVACVLGYDQIVSVLVESTDNVEDKNWNESLLFACLMGHRQIVKLLLDVGVHIEAVQGIHPIHAACIGGDVEIVSMLIQAGADVNVRYEDQSTCLHHAAWYGRTDVVRMLIDLALSVSGRDDTGNTPLHVPADQGQRETVQVLLEHGLDINMKNENGDTSFIYACWQGHLKTAETLVQRGADVNVTNKDDRSALHSAANNGKVDTVKWLLSLGLSVTGRSNIGDTPLHEAASQGQSETVPVLLEHGAELDARNNNNDTPFLLACRNGHMKTAQLLEQKGADVTVVDQYGRSALHNAACGGHTELVSCLTKRELDINRKDKYGSTSFTLACWQGHVKTAETLVQRGADVNVTDKDDRSALHSAANNGKVDTVKWLLSLGLSNSERSNTGNTPLHGAASQGQSETVQVLLEHGAELDARNNNNDTPFLLACRNGHMKTAQLLQQKGADVTAVGQHGRSVLHHAAYGGHTELVSYLIERGLDINGKDISEQTPLYLASWQGRLDTVKLLLDKGASVNTAEEDGYTPLHVACYKGHTNIAALLVERGADINTEDNSGQTPLQLARSQGKQDTVEFLLNRGATEEIRGATDKKKNRRAKEKCVVQ